MPEKSHAKPMVETRIKAVETGAGLQGAIKLRRSASPGPRPARRYVEDGQGASNRTPRQINRDLVFNQIRTRQPISRADLARVSGLQRSTISSIVEELIVDTWVIESAMGESPRGRKPTHLAVNSNKAVIAVDIHPAQTTVAVADLSGNIRSERRLDLPSDPEQVISAIVRAVSELVDSNPQSAFLGIGVTLPGRFSRKLDKAIFAPNVAWPIADVKPRLEEAIHLPVAADNVANACAISEVWFGYSDANSDLVAVNVSEGIGTGIYANGRLLRGERDGAGEFGHVQVDPAGPQCGCGSRGCWETVSSNRAALRYYEQASGQRPASFDAILELALGQDAFALQAIAQMSHALGRGMQMIVAALAPSEIVVVGELTQMWSFAEPIILSELRSFPLIEVPRLRMPAEPDRARLRSAVALVMNDRSVLLKANLASSVV